MRVEKILCVLGILVLGVLAHAKYVEVKNAPPTRGPNMAEHLKKKTIDISKEHAAQD